MPRASDSGGRHLVGLISDTHGRLDPRVASVFAGVERIVHAGDIGADHVIYELEQIAPVTAVLGNCDHGGIPGFDLDAYARIDVGGVGIGAVHIRRELPNVPKGVSVVVFGHSHMPAVEVAGGVLWVNPGSASQARRSPIGRSVAILEIEDGEFTARIVALSEAGATA